jgi:hypothetical protein
MSGRFLLVAGSCMVRDTRHDASELQTDDDPPDLGASQDRLKLQDRQPRFWFAGGLALPALFVRAAAAIQLAASIRPTPWTKPG